MPRELFASEGIGPGLVVREGQVPGSAPHLVFTPTRDTYGRLDRREVEELRDELTQWLGR